MTSTPREQLRSAIRAGWSMDQVSQRYRAGLLSEEAFIRFERLWAWASWTSNPRTLGVPVKRWWERGERIRRAARAIMANG